MQDANTSTAAATLQTKLQRLTEQTAAKVANICRRYCVQSDAAAAMTADITDMLHARYRGLCATTAQMREVSQKVKQGTWNNTGNGAICFIAAYYAEISSIIDGTPVVGAINLHAVTYHEAAKRLHITDGELIARFGGTLFADDFEAGARRLYYLYSLLVVAEFTDATEAELLTIQHPDNITAEQRRRVISQALDFQAQRRAAAEARKAKREERNTQRQKDGAARPDRTPTLFDGEQTIALYQSVTNMLSGGIQTADGDNAPLRPLREALEEQRHDADEVLNNPDAPEEQKQAAAQFLATTTGVWQALDGMQVITQTISPDASGNTYSRYDLTPNRLTTICTNQDNPNKEQTLNCLRAFAWLDTQRMRVVEKGTKTIREVKADGKVKRKEVQRDIFRNFRPVVVEFLTEYEDKVLIEDATRIRLLIHDIIRYGRSIEYDKENKLRIDTPRRNLLQLSQFYDFRSDEERAFRYIILSKNNLREDKLLAAVFDYTGRQAEYNRRADEAQRVADTLSNSPAATEEQKQAALIAAQQAREAAKYNITNHMGRDAERLKTMFDKARQNGLILSYERNEASLTKNGKKYGAGYVWKWERPDADEVKRRRGSR